MDFRGEEGIPLYATSASGSLGRTRYLALFVRVIGNRPQVDLEPSGGVVAMPSGRVDDIDGARPVSI